MKLYHQTGHNWVWNLESLQSSVGDGMILSPVNIPKDTLEKLSLQVHKRSFFDPQIYLPRESKRHLSTYDYFPANIADDVNTVDYDVVSAMSARRCIEFQVKNLFSHIVIPVRHYEITPSSYFEQTEEHFIEPFVSAYKEMGVTQPLLLTVIVKQVQVLDSEQQAKLLNWITGLDNISGVYVIFENNFISKQIKHSFYLSEILKFIGALRFNELEVHIGYSNVEGFLYSVVDPTSVSMGGFENLRSFGISRFETSEKKRKNQPNPRLYIGQLLQWVQYGHIDSIRRLYDEWDEILDPSPYIKDLFSPTFKWSSQSPELYKHYFWVFNQQIINLPGEEAERIRHVRTWMQTAMERFEKIKSSGVILDDDSDGSHLPFWLTALNTYERSL